MIMGLLLLVGVTTASAGPIIAIDLDPGMDGIQSALTVDPGDAFTIDVVLTGDGVLLFDTSVFAVDFNDLGAVLGLAPAGLPGLPEAGLLAGTAPLIIDFAGGAARVPGDPLRETVVLPNPPYTETSGLVGLIDQTGSFFGGPIPSGNTIDIFSLRFVALAPGTATVEPFPTVVGGLLKFNTPIEFTTGSEYERSRKLA